MSPQPMGFLIAVGGFTLLTAVIDVRTRRIPNVLTVPAFLVGIAYHVAVGFISGDSGPGERLLFSLGGFAIGFGLFLLMWMTGTAGGGDVKFMGAIGAWVGPQATLAIFLVGAVYVLLGSVVLRIWGALQPVGAPSNPPPPGTTRPARRVMVWGVPLALAVWSVFIYAQLCGKQ